MATKTPDKYQDQIDRLVKMDADEMYEQWNNSLGIFQIISPKGSTGLASGEHRRCGCLTEIRSGERLACNPKLTAAIRADETIPASIFELKARWSGMTVADRRDVLAPFRLWQMKVDAQVREKSKKKH